MKRLLLLLPLLLIIADLGFSLTLTAQAGWEAASSAGSGQTILGLPDWFFDWLPTAANALMFAFMLWAFGHLMAFNRHVSIGKPYRMGPPQVVALASMVVLSATAVWGWLWQIIHLVTEQRHSISFDSPRYLLVAVLLPYPGLLCLYRLGGWWRQRKGMPPVNIDNRAQVTQHGSVGLHTAPTEPRDER
ncbi:MAG: hypothetical protein KBC57_04920 [Neisseriaceae bacterium]|nr:hypothetical protein [Neisseriaceae bacterium]MBP6861684.1 hypothetical protein [Neisseriaceae bacterium]